MVSGEKLAAEFSVVTDEIGGLGGRGGGDKENTGEPVEGRA